jgi:hypothetical protein
MLSPKTRSVGVGVPAALNCPRCMIPMRIKTIMPAISGDGVNTVTYRCPQCDMAAVRTLRLDHGRQDEGA